MKIPKLNNLSTASQLSLLAVVILLGAIFFTINSALQQQNGAGRASVSSHANIFIRAATHASNPQTKQFTLTTPTNIVAGDTLIAHVVVHGATTTITAPTGWTLIRRDNTGTSTGVALYRYTATGVDAKNFVWTFNTAEEASGGIVDLANVDGITPVDASSGKYNYSSSSITAPSVTTTTNGDELLFFGAVDGSATVTVPSGMNAHWTTSTTHTTSYMANQKLTAVGPTGNRVGQSSTSNSNIAQLLALKPSTIIVPPSSGSPIPSNPSPSISIVPPGGNLVVNPSFESGTSSWNLITLASTAATFTTTTATAKDGTASGLVSVTKSSNNNWEIQLKQGNLPIITGQGYAVSFWAKASTARTITSIVQQVGTPHTVYTQQSHNLTSTWKHFSYTFTPSGTSQSRAFIAFNVANATGKVWIDNVSYATSNIVVSPSPTSPLPSITIPPITVFPSISPTSPLPSITIPPITVFPTASPSPTGVPGNGSTVLAFTLGLHGIGTGGDSANPKSKGTLTPHRPTRQITVEIYDAKNQLVISKQGSVIYASSSGKFKGTINLGKQFASGPYTIKVRTEQYLRTLVPGIQNIIAGKTNKIPLTTLVVGDINGDNKINIVDYNILLGCYSDLLPPVDCKGNNKVLTDIDDDGNVNQFDYNLFLRELTNVGGQ